jgi:nucleotide-binding universal stress UspA family protein
MFKKILLAYDGSEAGQKALLESQEIAQWSDADVTLVAVTPLTAEFMGPEGGIYDLRKLEHEKSGFQKTLEAGVAGLQACRLQAFVPTASCSSVTSLQR